MKTRHMRMWVLSTVLVAAGLAVLLIGPLERRAFAGGPPEEMCGEWPYNPDEEGCCDGTVYGLADQACCGGEVYDLATQACCNGQVYNLETQCCCVLTNEPVSKPEGGSCD